MGYCASGSGRFTFDMSNVTEEHIEEILKGNECGCEIETFDFGTGTKNSEYYVVFPYASYREDLWHDFLRSTNGLLEEGEI